MKNILLLGAGRSSDVLIDYLLKLCRSEGYQLTVADAVKQTAHAKIIANGGEHTAAQAIALDGNNQEQCRSVVQNADVVISLLPPAAHLTVAQACVEFGKPLLTASYVSPEMRALHKDAEEKGVLLLNELGFDPGIDHMSAMQIIDRLHAEDAVITAFRSYAGGLVAPEYDNNPWHYKFTWNPRNVVLAGKGTAKYMINGQMKYVPYHRLFSHTEDVFVEGLGDYEGYPNRDSVIYRELYGLRQIPTILRGTLRRKGFCAAWDTFVQLGMTDDEIIIDNSANMTYREFTNMFLQYSRTYLVEEKLAMMMNVPRKSELIDKIEWLGLFGHHKIGLERATPAQILQHLLEQKWKLEEGDRDMVILQHRFEYHKAEGNFELVSDLIVYGNDNRHTAMAKTVGLPLGIGAKLLLTNQIQLTGVQIPVKEEIYKPILAELAELGIVFRERIRSVE
ncbi:MAG: saccharopine dehydrogenase C-terminal domain-containing protein [Cytophagales bacterium]|nr:saccharopine dehydrogenase NADP-binding domain-containing protein [Bernardetiaceae bacterium]MDW8205711.1 saccharopine dehydrogenase C-terminal domain-containing protein [Cytophagales bacterium]